MDAIYYGGVSVLQRKHVTKLAIHNKNTYTIINQGILIISKGGNNKGRGTKENNTKHNSNSSKRISNPSVCKGVMIQAGLDP